MGARLYEYNLIWKIKGERQLDGRPVAFNRVWGIV